MLVIQLHAKSWTRWEIQHRCHPRSQIRHGATYTVRRHRVHWQWDVAAIHLPGSFLVVRLKKTEANVDTSVFCLEAHGSKQARYVPFFSAAHSVLPQLDRPHLPKSGPRFKFFVFQIRLQSWWHSRNDQPSEVNMLTGNSAYICGDSLLAHEVNLIFGCTSK